MTDGQKPSEGSNPSLSDAVSNAVHWKRRIGGCKKAVRASPLPAPLHCRGPHVSTIVKRLRVGSVERCAWKVVEGKIKSDVMSRAVCGRSSIG